jgi:hypothetical protein
MDDDVNDLDVTKAMQPEKPKRHSQRNALADDVLPPLNGDEDLIPGLRPALIANPGAHPSRPRGRRRRSSLEVPALVQTAVQPDDTEGRVEFIFGETFLDTDVDSGADEQVAEETSSPASEDAGRGVPWTVVAITAGVLVALFLLGIELLK